MSQWGRVLWGLCLLSISLSAVYAAAAATNSNTPKINRRMTAAAFAQAGKKEGLEIWRVENFAPVAVSKDSYGKFYSGDSYIVMYTKNSRGSKSYDIHYWIGKDTSVDESGAVAILAVELDDSLGGVPVQHRETQEHESRQFQDYFKSGIRYLPGGVNSGFNHVNTNDAGSTKRLYQVKGKRNIRVTLIEPKVSAMNKGDSFILDSGKIIYVYNGANSDRGERLKAVSAGNQIRDQDHAGRAKVVIIDDSAKPEEVAEFFEALGGGSRAAIPDGKTAADDEKHERDYDANVVLYKVSDASGSLKVEKVAQKPLSKAALNTNDAFILDTVTSGIFAWVGKKSTKSEKDEAMKKAQEFLRTKNYPSWTPITRVIESGEPSTFKEYFTEWRTSGSNAGIGRGRRSVDLDEEEAEEQ